MKVLFVNPSIGHIIQSSAVKELEQKNITGLYPPLGILLLASVIQKEGSHTVQLLDLHPRSNPEKALGDALRSFKPDIVGISVKTFTLLDALGCLKQIREFDASVRTLIGGRHPTIYPEESIALADVDYIFSGEAEEGIIPLLNALEAGREPAGIPGVWYKKQGVIQKGGMAAAVAELDVLPLPARELLPCEDYFSSIGGRLMTTMQSSRGCPYKCTYCDLMEGKKFRYRSPENMLEEVKAVQKMGIREIFFVDDIFTIRKKRVMEFCDLLLKEGIKIDWKISSRVDCVDEEMLFKLKEAGCFRIHYGVESGSDTTLTRMKKGITTQKAKEAIRLTRKAGIESLGYFMIGSPGESRSEIEETIRFACLLDLDFVSFSTTVPYPATELYETALKTGEIKSDYWRDFARNPREDFVPQLCNEYVSDEELFRLTKSAYRRYYFRWNYIYGKLKALRSFSQLYRYSKEALKVFRVA